MSYNQNNPNGQATSANSAPVVISSDQSVIQLQLTGSTTSKALGLGATVTAYGNLRVTAEPGSIFNDPFDGAVIDTTDRWNAATVTGGFTITQASGGLVFTTNTTTTHSAYIDTRPSFAPLGLNFIAFGAAVKLEAQTSNFFVTNQHRFWGLGNRPASFVIGTPLLDAIGFEIDTTGQLQCVVYSNGTRVFNTSTSLTSVNLNTLVTPSTGYCRFGIAFRADTIIFYINSTEYPAATYSVSTSTFTLPAIQALPIRIHAINSGSTPSGTSTLTVSNLALGDTGSNSNNISDGSFGFRKATVKAASTAPTATDTALVVGISPNVASVISDGAGINGLGVSMVATNFATGAGNTSTAQLAASATFTGTVETIFAQQAISILLTSDQNGTLIINQYIDAAGLRKAATVSFAITAGVGFSRSLVANGNYFNLTFQNTGGSTTTTLNINTFYGTLPGSTTRGNHACSIDEIGGTALVVGQATMAASIPVVLSSNQTAIPVTQATLTKGTQGATGVTTQDLKDSGRTHIIFSATAVAAGATTTETAITLVKSSGTSATSSAASFVITSGKRFRITAISFATRGNATATIQTTTFNFRINTGGSVTTSSTPILLSARSATPATASAWDRVMLTIPDGFEILGDGTLQFGITAAATYVTNAPTWDVNIIGYEY